MDKQVALTFTAREGNVRLNVFEGDKRIYALPVNAMSAVQDSTRYFLLHINHDGNFFPSL